MSAGPSQDVTVTGGSGGTTARLDDMRARADVLSARAEEFERVLVALARAEADPAVLALAASPVTGAALEVACARFFTRAAGAGVRIRGIATALRGCADAYESADALIAASLAVALDTAANVAGHGVRTVVFHPVTMVVVGNAAVQGLVVATGVVHVWSAAKEAGVFDHIEQVTGIDVEEVAEHGAEAVLGVLADGAVWAAQQAGEHSDLTGAAMEHVVPGFVAGFLGVPPGLVFTPADWGAIPRDSQTLTGFVLAGLSPFGFFGGQTLMPHPQHRPPVDVHVVEEWTGRGRAGAGGADGAHAPGSVRALWERQWAQSRGRDNGRVRVEQVAGADGRRRHIVYVPATTRNTLRAGRETTDHTTNLETASGRRSAQHEVVRTAIEEAGVDPDDEVMLVGYSQGGLVAASLLADEEFRQRVNVTTVFTVGAPVSDFAPPDGVDMLSIEHEQDLVPDLDGARNEDTAEWTTLTVDLDEAEQREALAQKGWSEERIDAAFDGPVYAHGGELYDNTVTDLEEGGHPELTQWQERNSRFFDDPLRSTHSFEGARP
ncbi:hypothetical protein BJEO58_01726 [Brevibacterium jeotgali]|uniref:Alpha/beta hydrolase family protein n=1 Tax=Brevibacterium jeotgali TaxID=1262550 RepID=A0A2H1L5G0_9MICO|nr:hypothetical protein [Brevibacterium jeotgali]SMY12132.1 hypothetical protein BJEO58_01726 [Brevibacterium jeotgali]